MALDLKNPINEASPWQAEDGSIIIPVPVSTGMFSQLVGICRQTLATMDKDGRLKAGRTPSGKHKRYGQQHFDKVVAHKRGIKQW